MAHRLLHTLVLSSVIALDAIGCSSSHPAATPRDAGSGGDPPDDLDAGSRQDASPWISVRDAGPLEPDASPWLAEDAGPADSGALADAASPDGGHDLRTCEPGWPTTKAIVCEPNGDGGLICCPLPSLRPDAGEACCAPEEP